MKLHEGDAVITPLGPVGIISCISVKGRAGVRFVQNGRLHFYELSKLKRATLAEIQASPLRGVGCNQSQEITES